MWLKMLRSELKILKIIIFAIFRSELYPNLGPKYPSNSILYAKYEKN